MPWVVTGGAGVQHGLQGVPAFGETAVVEVVPSQQARQTGEQLVGRGATHVLSELFENGQSRGRRYREGWDKGTLHWAGRPAGRLPPAWNKPRKQETLAAARFSRASSGWLLPGD